MAGGCLLPISDADVTGRLAFKGVAQTNKKAASFRKRRCLIVKSLTGG
jgi:hypothetical protein